MSEIKQGKVHDLKKGSYVMVDDQPCVVKKVQISRPGKHGHAKARIQAVGILDDKKRVFVKPGDGRVEIPVVDKRNAQIISVNTEEKKERGETIKTITANAMDLESYETFNITVPKELWDKVKEGSQVLYWDLPGAKLMKRLM